MFSSSLSKISITSLHCLITFFKLDNPFAQCFRTLLSNLNFAEIFAKLFEVVTSVFQESWLINLVIFKPESTGIRS
jgi:hypothetical protein